MTKIYRIDFYVPESHLEVVKDAIFKAGAGSIGGYSNCCWVTKGKGQFKPLEGSSPFYGEIGFVKYIDEYKVEMVCNDKSFKKSIDALIKAHPYDEPAYQYWVVNQ